MALPVLVIGGVVAAIAFAVSQSSSSSSKGNAPGGGALPPHAVPSIYDAGMPQDVQAAVTKALATETNPDNLTRFASSLRPDFPIAAGLLEQAARARQAQQQQGPAIPAPPPPMPAVFPTPPAVSPPPIFPGGVLPPAPPPVIAIATVTTDVVSTQTDPLNVRNGPGTEHEIIGRVAKGSTVAVNGGPVPGTGATSWLPITGINADSGGPISGFAASDFLTPTGQLADAQAQAVAAADAGLQAILAHGADLPAVQMATVTTSSTTLNLRSGPSATAPIVGELQKGSRVAIAGKLTTGFYPVSQDGLNGFASAQFLTLDAVGFVAGAFLPRAELIDYANRLEAAVKTRAMSADRCEPIVLRFQRAAKEAGVYRGPVDGFFTAQTRSALVVVLEHEEPLAA